MTGIVRVSVTFPPDLLEEFDEVIKKMGYANRSKAIQDAVRAFVNEFKHLHQLAGERAGVIAMVYEHHAHGLSGELTHIQHKFGHVICSTMHIHLTPEECLEAIAVRGDIREINQLAQELKVRKGVRLVKTVIVF